MPFLPKNNAGAALGALLTAFVLAVVQAIYNAAVSGQPVPATREDWIRFGAVILGGAVMSLNTPRGSLTELRSGYRTVNPPPGGSDAPVVDEAKAKAMERDALKRESSDV